MPVKQHSPPGSKRRRGVYVLPSFVTLANMFVGFFALINAVEGRFSTAAYMLIVAGFLDMLDGRIARLTKTQTDFGKELDSFTDLVSFGIVPSLVIYLYALRPMGRLGWLIAFFFTACGAIRLARFNLLSVQKSANYFVGLPIPIAAQVLVFLILLFPQTSFVYPYITFAAACLMVSSIPYPSFKQLDGKTMRPTYTMILIVLGFVIIAYKPVPALFVLLIAYLCSGPFVWLKRRVGNREAVALENNEVL